MFKKISTFEILARKFYFTVVECTINLVSEMIGMKDIVSFNKIDIIENVFSESLIELWIKFADVRPSSQRTYAKALTQMLKFFYSNHITSPTRADIEKWKSEMLVTKKASTVQLYIITTKLFFKFLSQHNLYPNITDNMKSAKVDHEYKKDALTVNQCQALLQSIDISTTKGLRDRAIISLMITAGLRTIEVVRADVGDLHSFADSVYLSVQGKGHDEKSAKVLVASQVYAFIQEYLQTRKNLSNSEPLFTSTSRRNFNKRLDTQSISKLVKAKLRAISIDDSRHTAHSLRHTAATQALLNGVPLTQVQQVLRHTNINTTLIYSHAIERMKNKSEQTVADAIFN